MFKTISAVFQAVERTAVTVDKTVHLVEKVVDQGHAEFDGAAQAMAQTRAERYGKWFEVEPEVEEAPASS